MSTTTASYQPQEGSVASRVIHFLQVNPDENLAAHDVAVKFGCGHASVHTILARSVDAGLLRRTKNEDGDMVYSPGTRAAPPPAAAPATAARTAAFVLHAGMVKVERGVPLPPAHREPGASQRIWDEALALLQVSDSFALPGAAKPSAAKHLARHAKASGRKYTQRGQDGQLRVWRVA